MKKREHPKFLVPNYGAKKRKRVGERWRKQQGIDNKKRLGRSGYGASPNIGYGNPAELKHLRHDGTREVLVRNEAELLGTLSAKNVSIRLSHSLSSRKKLSLQKLAEERGIKVVNRVKV